jgi:hypothetical protein
MGLAGTASGVFLARSPRGGHVRGTERTGSSPPPCLHHGVAPDRRVSPARHNSAAGTVPGFPVRAASASCVNPRKTSGSQLVTGARFGTQEGSRQAIGPTVVPGRSRPVPAGLVHSRSREQRVPAVVCSANVPVAHSGAASSRRRACPGTLLARSRALARGSGLVFVLPYRRWPPAPGVG